eukprot:CAMPEP_0171918544 /NCGR_PEP_ID=MMETSP0993-20121228/17286_1 /TAXON_ID=483369 /ORGANISM="non described non described, Strain CCMP2098" /LENGTH=111 /DNA_ID=CAMNT_0012554931 /DNA_START=776 /DNA_END=1111 /DNA_ORIENTATION=-
MAASTDSRAWVEAEAAEAVAAGWGGTARSTAGEANAAAAAAPLRSLRNLARVEGPAAAILPLTTPSPNERARQREVVEEKGQVGAASAAAQSTRSNRIFREGEGRSCVSFC